MIIAFCRAVSSSIGGCNILAMAVVTHLSIKSVRLPNLEDMSTVGNKLNTNFIQ